jgi:hypothetical protein
VIALSVVSSQEPYLGNGNTHATTLDSLEGDEQIAKLKVVREMNTNFQLGISPSSYKVIKERSTTLSGLGSHNNYD